MFEAETSALIYPMAAHVAWIALLYVALTVVRAPTVWRLGRNPDGSNPFADVEPRVSANLRNQFEWPLLFYVVCLLELLAPPVAASQPALAWIFVAGRLLHSGVQIATTNIRLRGLVFTINFAAVLLMWGVYLGR